MQEKGGKKDIVPLEMWHPFLFVYESACLDPYVLGGEK